MRIEGTEQQRQLAQATELYKVVNVSFCLTRRRFYMYRRRRSIRGGLDLSLITAMKVRVIDKNVEPSLQQRDQRMTKLETKRGLLLRSTLDSLVSRVLIVVLIHRSIGNPSLSLRVQIFHVYIVDHGVCRNFRSIARW